MKFNEIFLKGAYLIELTPFIDERGVFTRLFCEQELTAIGHYKKIVQINHSLNKQQGTVRGLHFQKSPHAEIKIVRCIHGRIWDVIVDIRKDSPTFLQWFGVELSLESYNAIYIPGGFAHGFQTLTDNAQLLYFHTEFYHPASEGGLRFNDPSLKIDWKQEVTDISTRDQHYPLVPEIDF